VSLGGKLLRSSQWDYDRRQRRLKATLTGRKLRLVVRRRCG
jgi:hypothetical protein